MVRAHGCDVRRVVPVHRRIDRRGIPRLMTTTGSKSTDLVAECVLLSVAAYKATLRVEVKLSSMFGSYEFPRCR